MVVIVGPTASGKSDLGVVLARKFGGEIVSADSRQVYKGLDIGAGKITKAQMRNVPHYLLDVALPSRRFSVSQYQKLALKAIASIHAKHKVPFLVGGSPLYVFALTDGWQIPEVKPSTRLRSELEKLSTEELLIKLRLLDSRRAETIEQKNRRRLIRALEIVLSTRKPVPPLAKKPFPYPVLFLGIQRSEADLKKRIRERLVKRLRQGMVKEVERLHAIGLSFARLDELGLEYKYVALYLQKKLSKQDMREKLERASLDFSRRQMTWFKRDSRIHWIRTIGQAEKAVRQFLKDS